MREIQWNIFQVFSRVTQILSNKINLTSDGNEKSTVQKAKLVVD